MRKNFGERHADAITRRDHGARPRASGGTVETFDVSTRAKQGVLVFSPHPDDEVIGCGGALLDLAAAGAAVTIVQVTDGSDSGAFIDEPDSVRRSVRLDEARLVAARIGAGIVCLAADNRSLRGTAELGARSGELIQRLRPGLVFVPSFTDIHPDHQTVLQLVADALREMPEPRPDVALYEVWSLVTPTHAHPVDARIGTIEELLLLYETALKIDDYVHLVAERLLYNACEYQRRPGYAEVFDILPAQRFVELAANAATTTYRNA